MIETTGDLIQFVLRASGISGVGQTPMPEDSNTGLDFLKLLLAQWQRKRWLVWNEQQVSCVATGANTYTIGPGQDFDTARPDKLHAAWVTIGPGVFTTDDGAELAEELPFPLGAQPTTRTPQMVDVSLSIIEAYEDWATIAIKDLKSIPAAVFYDSAWPIGTLRFWPVPPASVYELHLVVKGQLPVFTTLTDPLALPDEYIEALVWSLCVRMQMAYGLPSRPDHVQAMRQALETIKMANAQIPLLSMPHGLGGHRGDHSSWSGGGLNQAWTVSGPSVLS
jgi:hypothetical protein